jgi:multidrug resistance efflux pump
VEEASAPSLVFTPPSPAEGEQPAPERAPKPAEGPLLRPPTAEELIGAKPLMVGMDNKVRPAQPGEQVDIDEISGTKPENKLLASAAVFVREGKPNEAKRALESVLEISPNNVQALTMLELISSKKKKKPKPRTGARRGRGLLVFLLLLVLLICGAAAAAMLITLPQQVTLPCTTSLVPLPEVRSSVEGTITEVKVSKGEVVKMGAVLALATNERLVRRIAELKARIADDEELVRIMKTAGTAKDDARLRKERKRLTKEIAELKKGCGNEECQVKLLELEKQLKRVKTKLRFCEWEALPKEIKQAERELIKAHNELKGLTGQKTEAEIKSPTGGIVVEISAKGTTLTKGAKLARMMVSNQIVVETTKGASQRPRKGLSAKITLKGKSTLSLSGTVDKVLAGGRFSCRVMTDATKIQKEGGACSVAIELGEITLLNWLKKKYL